MGSLDFTAEEFLKLFTKFRKSVWFRVFYLAILALIVVGLYQGSAGTSPTVCLSLLLIPVSVFVLPYWLGERRLRHLLLNALPVFLAATLIIGVLQTDSTFNVGPVQLDTGPWTNPPAQVSLWNGTVEPQQAPPGTNFTFHVRLLKTGVANGTPVSVYLNLTTLGAFTAVPWSVPMTVDSAANNSNGTWYVATQTLGSDLYGFYFFANQTNGNWTATAGLLQPITASWASVYAFWISWTGLRGILFPAIFYLLIVFMYWYTVRTRKLRQRMMERRATGKAEDTEKKPAGEEGDTAAEGKAGKVAAFTCTNCGADVTEDDEKCPKCGAVFED